MAISKALKNSKLLSPKNVQNRRLLNRAVKYGFFFKESGGNLSKRFVNAVQQQSATWNP